MWEIKVSKVKDGQILDGHVAAAVWLEEDGWHAYGYNKNMNRYFFNDISEENIIESWKALDEMQGAILLD